MRWVGLLIAAALLVGCRADAPTVDPAVALSFESTAEAIGEGDTLVVWVKRETTQDRLVLPAPATVSLEGWDPASGPLRVDLVPGAALNGELAVFAVVVNGKERAEGDAWRFGLPEAIGAVELDTDVKTADIVLGDFVRACDLDGDYFQSCSSAACCTGPLASAFFADCLDTEGDAHPFQDTAFDRDQDRCDDGVDWDCLGGDDACEDGDGDGVSADEDCDDRDAARAPGLPEICGDDVDQDCGLDEDRDDPDCVAWLDGDGDGWCPEGQDIDGNGDCFGEGVGGPSDCNDANPSIHPGVPGESNCDGQDEDCDGRIDEGLTCDDIDGDGRDDDEDCVEFPAANGLPGAYDSGRSPEREEICGNGVDENCDGIVEACDDDDADGDGFVDALKGGRDCDDTNRFVHPDAAEVCGDGLDNDCRGGDVSCTSDGDGDGFNADVDCDDGDPGIHPDREGRVAVEICDLKDNNCNGIIDEGNPLVLKLGDPQVDLRCGFNDIGDCRLGWSVCSRVGGESGIVCAGVAGPENEVCNGEDDDCNGEVDNGVKNSCGGCAVLRDAPGASCGTCKTIECDGIDDTACRGRDPNACGGCRNLGNQPGASCGRCNLDEYVCDAPNRTVCDGDTAINACGGCGDLGNEPGDDCGPCNLDEFVCDGRERLSCDGNTTRNVCGGCNESDRQLGDDCGDCGTIVCNGDDPVCNDPGENACGGCGDLQLTPGDDCGPCGLDEVECNNEQAVCDGNTTANDCGGCEDTDAEEGDDCGECGRIECQGGEPVCNDGNNGCGGCDELSETLGEECANNCIWDCDGTNGVHCVRRNNRNRVCD